MSARIARVPLYGALAAVLAICAFLSICIGESYIGLRTVIAILLHPLLQQDPFWSSADETIVLLIRLPRMLLAALVGSGLAVSGAVLQSLFRNPMADPFILGISSGAAFGAAAVMMHGISFGLGLFNLPFAAFLCGAATILLVYQLARVGRRVPTYTLLLSGIAVSAFMSACTSFLLFTSQGEFNQIIFWMMGGFAGRTWDHVLVALPFTVFGGLAFFTLSRPLNALMFGEESALYLGIQVERLKKVLLAGTVIVTGAAVAVSGPIGFVGLITPHVVRLFVGPDHRVLLPVSILTGAIFLIVADMVSRTLIAPAELPIGVVTALCGAPFFLFLLKRKRGEA